MVGEGQATPVNSMVKAFILVGIRGLSSEGALERYLEDHPEEASLRGFKDVPWHSTLSRFRRGMGEHFFQGLFRRVRAILDGELPYKVALVNSTPIPKPDDPEAEVGFYTRGAFKGFKVHAASREHGLPGSTMVATGNRHHAPSCLGSLRIPAQ
ncbi:MAG: transposase [Candidatus Bathyarchaeia archaeon]